VKWERTSLKAKTQMRSPSLDPVSSLEELDGCLHTLISVAEKGDWENVDDFSERLLNALNIASAPDFLSRCQSRDIESVQATLTLLQQAIQQCSLRKEQISPLVKALTKPQAKP